MTRHSDLTTRIAGTICEQRLFTPDDTLIIGLSGGADSTALLNLLANLPGVPRRLVAAHLNHCLRGTESDADEEFCLTLANRFQIPFEVRRVDVRELAKNHSLNLEDAGRQARIAFFDELCVKYHSSVVVLAHHADDQAETVLMRLLRGSGMTGLAGIPYRNGRGYVRPLLDITRSEIEAYLSEHGMTWREDSSNQDTTMLRNRIRHELLPLLEQYNPSIRACLSTTAKLLSVENDLLNDQANRASEQIFQTTKDGIAVALSSFLTQPLALQRRIIRQALSNLLGNLQLFSHQHIDAICHMARSSRPHARINLPQNIIAIREYDTLVLRHGEVTPSPPIDLRITGPGMYQLPNATRLWVESVPAPDQLNQHSTNTAHIDLVQAPFPWHVRTFMPGDRMQPFGMTGRKKLKDLFIDDKLPRSQRCKIPLIFSGDELIWVCGLRTSQAGSLKDGSSQIAKVVFSPSE